MADSEAVVGGTPRRAIIRQPVSTRVDGPTVADPRSGILEVGMKKTMLLVFTHALFALAGFAAGIYFLPILTAPEPPPVAEVERLAGQARFTGTFRRDLAGSDALHWGEGTVSVADDAVSLMGKIAPGPDYRLYLAPEFADDEASFNAIKARSVQVGDVKVFENFIVEVPSGVDVAAFNTVVVWCESFGEFISAAQYR